jgi:hypothetical protein
MGDSDALEGRALFPDGASFGEGNPPGDLLPVDGQKPGGVSVRQVLD